MSRRHVLSLVAAALAALPACDDGSTEPSAARSAGTPAVSATPTFVQPQAAEACTVEWRAHDAGATALVTTDGAAQVVVSTRTPGGTAGPQRTVSVLQATADLPVELETTDDVGELTATADGKPCRVSRQ